MKWNKHITGENRNFYEGDWDYCDFYGILFYIILTIYYILCIFIINI